MAARRKKKNRFRAKGLMLTKIILSMFFISNACAIPSVAADRFRSTSVLGSPSPAMA